MGGCLSVVCVRRRDVVVHCNERSINFFFNFLFFKFKGIGMSQRLRMRSAEVCVPQPIARHHGLPDLLPLIYRPCRRLTWKRIAQKSCLGTDSGNLYLFCILIVISVFFFAYCYSNYCTRIMRHDVTGTADIFLSNFTIIKVVWLQIYLNLRLANLNVWSMFI